MICSMPLNLIPQLVLIHLIMFVTKQLNLFSVKGSVLAVYSPKQIMTGEAVTCIACSMGFATYCQIHKESTPHNGLAAPTQGALSLGPSGNVQAGHTFFTLHTHWQGGGKAKLDQAPNVQ